MITPIPYNYSPNMKSISSSITASSIRSRSSPARAFPCRSKRHGIPAPAAPAVPA